jgi:hypothetical protein
MTHPNKIAANQRNAKLSTGPRTAAGKLNTRANGATHGLHATLVVVERAGETVEEWKHFREGIMRELQPVGPLEAELAGRAAELMWRLRRPARYEAAVAAAAAANLPPDHTTITGEGIDPLIPLPANATAAQKLAVVRRLLTDTRNMLDVAQRAVELMRDLPTLPADTILDWGAAEQVVRTAGDVLGWMPFESWSRWEAVLKSLGAALQSEWTAGLLTRALAAAAESVGYDVTKMTVNIGETLVDEKNELATLIATREGEERELVAQMLGERARTAAAALYADERAMVTVTKVERHLGRELERVLKLLNGLQAARSEWNEPLGEVLGGVLALGGQGEVPALAEERGFGPVLSLLPSGRESVAEGEEAFQAGG